MKKATLQDGHRINCISVLEAQMLDLHIAGYLDDEIIINNGDTIVDVGANIGMLGYRISQRYTDIQIIALEPIEDIYKVLKQNSNLSKNDKFLALPYGLSNKNETINRVRVIKQCKRYIKIKIRN